MSRHTIVNDDIVLLSITPKICAISSKGISFLVLDESRQDISLELPLTKHIENTSDVCKLDIELNKVGDISLFFSGIHYCSVSLVVEGN